MAPGPTAVHPSRAIEGGRATIHGSDFPIDEPQAPDVRIGDHPARVVYASRTRIDVLVPPGIVETSPLPVRVAGVGGQHAAIEVGVPFASGLHQVDNPVFDREGNLYVTYSGTRGQQVPVSIFKVRPNGTRETFSSGIVNPTSMAIDPDGNLYASSRFEGVVYRLDPDGSAHPFATDLGIACGLAFAPDGTLFVGDRSGTVFKVDRAGRATAFASLPASVAAFHIAVGPDGSLYVSAPTLSSYDGIYRISPDGAVQVHSQQFGRPQGLAFDAGGTLFVIEALAGQSGLFRLPPDGQPELVLSGPGLIGVAFNPHGGLVVCSNDKAFRTQKFN
jgi:DNA-binding beta-propeller fold protein YncE